MKDAQYPRHFVPKNADMGDWAQIEPLFKALDARPIDAPEQLDQWLLDSSELAACISEESSKRYVAMTCQTDDPEREKAHLFFVEQISPKCKPWWHQLRIRYVKSPAREKLPKQRYFVYDRSTVTAERIFRDENVPLQTEEEKLDQQYQKICGAMTVQYDGKEQTLQQMAKYQLEPDRKVRQATWELVVKRRLVDREPIEDIYDKMIGLRHKIAVNADLANFRDYQFLAYERFDYTPQDCIAFHKAVEKVAVPANRAMQKKRRNTLKVDVLRPWDLNVDPLNQPPLRPYEGAEQLKTKCSQVFHRLSSELGGQFDEMIQAGWLDLDSRKGKAPGGYQATFDEARHPFIFMNAVGLHRDVETLLHEGGHAFHSVACREDPLVQYRHAGMEMAEVASMGMELLAYDCLDIFYTGKDLARARREQLESIISFFPWMATIDAFQHWIYTDASQVGGKPDREKRKAYWLSLQKRFGGIEDWSGYDEARAYLWERQLHLFGVPFYYVEYGIAQIGALQLWQNARRDRAGALRKYREALALGGSRPLPELWKAAGLTLDFSEKTLRPLIDAVQEELKKLKD